MPVSDSSIRSEGAELFVQAVLMLEYGIITSRASRNMPGYDVIAHNLDKKSDCKISVKFRKAANCDGFQFTRVDDFDIFVGIIGRRGRVGKNSASQDTQNDMLSEVFILSQAEVQSAIRKHAGKLFLPRRFVQEKSRRGAWSRILDFLDQPKPQSVPGSS